MPPDEFAAPEDASGGSQAGFGKGSCATLVEAYNAANNNGEAHIIVLHGGRRVAFEARETEAVRYEVRVPASLAVVNTCAVSDS